ncbi:MAG: tandem-95 repeat protein, partial [Desulfobacterales bacterium]|nr:tandem-95 repeat protein [Desulfobacterales bacterium]
LLSNDSDVDGPGALAVVGVGAASGGNVSLQGGQVVFSPYGNFNGWAGFNYVVSDGAGGLSQARVDLHYQPVNDAPVATGEIFSGDQDVQYSFNAAALLANDWDPDGDNLSLSSVGSAQHGSVSLSGNSVVFTPATGYAGAASFDYTVSDSSGAQAYATTTLNLVHRNFAPVTIDDSFTTYEDTPIVITDTQVLSNDSDDGGRENLRAYVINPASHDPTYSPQGGSLSSVDIDHSVMFTPTPNYSGMGSFWYRAQDAEGLYTLTRIYVSILPVNDAPVAADNYVTALRNTPVLISASQLLSNDSDVDGAPGTYTVVGVDGPVNGTLAVQPDGASVLFTPSAGFSGAASFGYT